ncbi:MAG: DUF2490 domain-containing protein [Paludibacteraceae bacterium]|nr:DUF2490 domain-containing protein [Paludibacteraceae bacterium]
MDKLSFASFRFHCLVLLVTSFGCLGVARAGGDRQDFTSSVDFSVSKRVCKRLNVGLAESVSLRSNSTKLDKFYTKAGLSYNVIKGVLRVGADYYLIGAANKKDDIYLNHRCAGYLRVKKDVSRFSFGLKSKYQITYRPEKAQHKQYKDLWRNKLYVSAKIPKTHFFPTVAAEAVYRTNYYKGNRLEKLRYEAGVKYKFNKSNSLQALFRYDDGMNVANPKDVFGVVLSYSLDL